MEREWIEELLAKTDLVSLISKYVRLSKKGSDYWGCCPFHYEKTPSFKIYESTNSYHCFGCKESGDAITFVSKIESIDRIDAIKILAEQAGMQLPKYDKSNAFSGAEVMEKKERLYALLKDAARFYYDNLQSKDGEPYKQYLLKRKIGEGQIVKFGIGASLDWTGLIDHLKNLGYSTNEMKDAGVAQQGTEGLYDVFKGRVMFPIINSADEVVSFSGRVIESETDFAKYKNGRQTLVFDKSKTLFGINLLKKKKRTTHGAIEYVILVEGHLDTVMMHSAGFDTAVASMGTALTHAHAKQIKNFSDRVYISYDGDAAGSKATMKGLDILAQTGINVRVIILPERMDPDDVIKQFGTNYYKQLIENAETLTQYKINSLKKQFDLNDAEGKSKFAVSAVKIIRGLDSPVQREEYLKQISEITGYTMTALMRQSEVSEKEQIVPTVNAPRPTEEKLDESSVYVLAYIAIGRPIPDGINPLEALEGIYLDIYQYLKEKGANGLYSSFEEEYNLLIGEILNFKFDGYDGEEAFIKHISSLLRQKYTREKDALSLEYEKTKDIELLKQISTLDRRLKQIGFGGR